ncbi:MAG TPA: recombination mediator RecR [Candidatus Margulisiibacteriota bacterium]|nr:recombination mediator RecR [Candidatus Margulisiibacteriota bacterium]
MSALPAPLARLIQELVKLPGIGEKTATRLAFHLLRTDRCDVDTLAEALIKMREGTRLCSVCLGLTADDPCALCSDPQRDAGAICVVERPADLIALERSGQFKGRYHVLHGCLAPLDGVGPEELRIAELLRRLEDGSVREVVIATNPTVEGEATALYLSRLIKPLNVRVTRIAHGLPMGADVEYADTMTLGKALEGRREM